MLTTTDVHRSPRRRTADARRRQIVARYHRSDLTQRAFCAQAGIPLSTLQWWLVKGRREVARDPPVGFTEVTLPEVIGPDRGADLAWAMERVTREGITIRWREAVPLPHLVAVLGGA